MRFHFHIKNILPSKIYLLCAASNKSAAVWTLNGS